MKISHALNLLGINELRPFQQNVLDALLRGQDAACFAPTSSGKSAIFQMYGLITERLVVVVEPHLALEVDQVVGLTKRGIPATCLNSLQGGLQTTFPARQNCRGAIFDSVRIPGYVAEQSASKSSHCLRSWRTDRRRGALHHQAGYRLP